MTVYVESYFLLELAFEQEEFAECRELLGLAEAGRIALVFPTCSVAECIQTLGKRRETQKDIREAFRKDLNELGRSARTASLSEQLRHLTASLITGAEENYLRYDEYVRRLLDCAGLIPLSDAIIRQSFEVRTNYGLDRPDSLVLASVLSHLPVAPAVSLFINRNSRHFATPDIIAALAAAACTLKPTFRAGLAYLNAKLPPP